MCWRLILPLFCRYLWVKYWEPNIRKLYTHRGKNEVLALSFFLHFIWLSLVWFHGKMKLSYSEQRAIHREKDTILCICASVWQNRHRPLYDKTIFIVKFRCLSIDISIHLYGFNFTWMIEGNVHFKKYVNFFLRLFHFSIFVMAAMEARLTKLLRYSDFRFSEVFSSF